MRRKEEKEKEEKREKKVGYWGDQTGAYPLGGLEPRESMFLSAEGNNHTCRHLENNEGQ